MLNWKFLQVCEIKACNKDVQGIYMFYLLTRNKFQIPAKCENSILFLINSDLKGIESLPQTLLNPMPYTFDILNYEFC